MLPASHIKRTIDFNTRFRQLLEVLKLVAVAQYHALENKIRTFERIEDVLAEFFELIDWKKVDHPFLNPGDRPTGVVAITSDAGLLGGLNVQVMSKALDLLRNTNGRLVIVGERGQTVARDSGVPFVYFPGIIDEEKFSQAAGLRDYLIERIMAGAIGPLKIVFPRAISVVVHRVEVVTLLPFSEIGFEGASPKEGEKNITPNVDRGSDDDMIMESTLPDVVEYLVYLFIGKKIYEIFGLSRLAEQAARFVHLEESCQKITEVNQKLFLQYFRRRHEIIDQNMRELFSARSIYAK